MKITITNDTSNNLPASYSYSLNLSGLVPFNSYGSNIYFTSSTSGNRIYSWYEGGGVFWVNIGRELLISSTVNVYVKIGTTGANYFNSSTGCSPLISTTYGEYDTGFKVFQFYDNFAGTVLSSTWTTITTNGGTYSVNNGITVSENTQTTDMRVVTKSTYSNGILEAYILGQTFGSYRGTGLEYDTVLPNSSGNNGQYGYRWMSSLNSEPGNYIQSVVNGGDNTIVSLGSISSSYNFLLTADWNETGYVAWFNNSSTTPLLSVNSSTVTYGPAYLAIYAGSDGSNIGTIDVAYIRFRTSFNNEKPNVAIPQGLNLLSELTLVSSTIVKGYGFDSLTNTLTVVPLNLSPISEVEFNEVFGEESRFAFYEGFFSFPKSIGVIPPNIPILEFMDSFFEGLLPVEHIYEVKNYDLIRQQNVVVMWVDDLDQTYIGFGNESWGDYSISADIYLIGQNTNGLLDNIVSTIHQRVASFDSRNSFIELDKVVWIKLESEENFQSSVRGATKYRFTFSVRVYINELLDRYSTGGVTSMYMNISGESSTGVSTSYSSTILVNADITPEQFNQLMSSTIRKII